MNVFCKAAVCTAAGLLAFIAPQASAIQVSVGYDFATGTTGLKLVPGQEGELAGALANYAPAAQFGGFFSSFCVEASEVLYIGGPFNVTVSNSADGSGPLATRDVLSQGSAYLIERFALGTLAGVPFSLGDTTALFSYTNAASITALQQTIWFLEDDLDVGANRFDSLLNPIFGGTLKQDYTGSTVKVLNITGVNGERLQDQVVVVPNPVPDGGATIALLGLSMGGVALLRRKFAVA